MAVVEISGLREFLRDYPQMAVRPSGGQDLRLKGQFVFAAHHPTEGDVQDCFVLEISVPAAFPRDLPKVTETGGRIPRTGDYHVNPDGSLCLGSPLGLLLKISTAPSLPGFAEKCLVPYLFAIVRKLKSGGPMLFGELGHGATGLFLDYAYLFRLRTSEQAKYALKLLGMKKRRANKYPCPCGCRKALGRCNFNRRLNTFRLLASRSWFRAQAYFLTH